MTKRISRTKAHKDLIRRYLLWFFKTTKESFERIERKTTQVCLFKKPVIAHTSFAVEKL